MKKILFLVLACMLMPTYTFSQSKEIKQKFKHYTDNKVYTIDRNNIVVTKVIKDLPGTAEEIYFGIKHFFTMHYRDGDSVIQTDDKESGVIIGKGLFKRFWECRYMGLQIIEWSAFHTMRVDIKDGRVRLICSASIMEYEFTATHPHKKYDYYITEAAPITDERKIDKGKQTEAFVNLIDKMLQIVDELENTVQLGSSASTSNDW